MISFRRHSLRKAKIFGKKLPYIFSRSYGFELVWDEQICGRDTLKSLVWTFSRTLKYCSIVEGSCGVVTCWYSDYANLIFRMPQILSPLIRKQIAHNLLHFPLCLPTRHHPPIFHIPQHCSHLHLSTSLSLHCCRWQLLLWLRMPWVFMLY